MNTVKGDYKYDIEQNMHEYVYSKTAKNKEKKKKNKMKISRNQINHKYTGILNTEESIFDTKNSNKENLASIDNLTTESLSKICYTSKAKDNSNEVYQCMPGFYKPKIWKYSLKISSVSCGDAHIGLITEGGHLYTMGSNQHGKLGLCDITMQQNNVPSLVDELVNYSIASVSCGYNHTAAITSNGEVFTWGDGRYGQLGHYTQETLFSPQLISHFINNQIKIRLVSCGVYHTGFISTNGKVYISGNTDLTSDNRNVRLIDIPEDWESICLGNIINADFIGQNFEVYGLILTKSGFVYYLGIDQEDPNIDVVCKVKELEIHFIKTVSLNSYFAAITDDGELYVWGSSIIGDYGSPTKIIWIPKSIKMVSLGTNVSACVDASGLVWAWGHNSQGELGVGDNEEK